MNLAASLALVVGLATLGGCGGAAECKDAKPLIGEVRAALGKADLTAAGAAAEKLGKVIESSADPELQTLKSRTAQLVAAIKSAQVAPTDASQLAARDASVAGIDSAIQLWQDASARAEANTCK